MAKYYELVIFTASLCKYANPLMNILDPKGLCTGRLFREHCDLRDKIYMKDMSRLGRRIEDVILIDNSPNSYRLQPENAIPIISWYDDL
jgi:RNA polymerase II subunit A small phosphatase-like protein